MHWQELRSASCFFCCLDTDENRTSVGRVGRRRHRHRLATSLSSTSCQLELHAGCVQQANGGLTGLGGGGNCKALLQPEETEGWGGGSKKRRRGCGGELVGFLCLTDTYY